MNKKVLVIFPKNDPEDSTHFPYWYQVFEEAGKKLDLAILFESGKTNVNIGNLKHSYVQKILIKPFNLIERLFAFIIFFSKDYRQIYIHYSLYSFILAWSLRYVFGLNIYLWDCELYDSRPKNKVLIWAIKQADFLVTGSLLIARSYVSVLEKPFSKIKIVPNYVSNYNVDSISLNKNSKHILFVHHLSPRKGSRELPQIINETLKNIPNAHFHVVGDGPDREWLMVRCAEFGIIDSITFYGNQKLTKVASLINSCDIFIMPSRSEGFPRVILEAMIFKIPFVSTKVGCVKEIVSQRQQQFLVIPGNVQAFVMAIKELENFKDKKQLIEENYIAAKRYSLKSSVSSFVKLF